MKFAWPRYSATDYAVFLECGATDRLALLQFMEYVTRERVYEQILALEAFKPSVLWKGWVSDTFVGFSSDQVLLKSGHRFRRAAQLRYEPAYAPSSPRDLLQNLRAGLRTARAAFAARSEGPEQQVRQFQRYYPNALQQPAHQPLMDVHPLPYLRALEVMTVARYERPAFVLEIGAGACANLALLRLSFGTRAAIVDLPETMYAGYLMLRTIFPDARIALPDEVARQERLDFADYDFVFLLPTQLDRLPVGQCDHAFNMSSFQEMEMPVVNNYLAVVRRALRPGGRLVLCNLEVSRQIPGNSLDAYDLAGFDSVQRLDAPYQNWGLRALPGVRQQIVLAARSGSASEPPASFGSAQ